MKKIRPFLFACMLVILSLSLTACAGRKNGNMNETGQNSATSSAVSETVQEWKPGKMVLPGTRHLAGEKERTEP